MKTICLICGLLIFFGCSKPFEIEAEFGVVIEGPGVIATPGNGLLTSEGGASARVALRLRTQPTANVILTLQSSNVAEGRLRATAGACDALLGVAITTTCTLTFTAGNWNEGQDIEVVGQDDLVTDGNALYTVFFPTAVSSADAKYNGLTPTAIILTNQDDDLPSVSVSAASGTTAEASGNFTFSIVLQAQPSANVTITLSSSNEAEGRIRRTGGICNTGGTVAAGSCTVTFTAANWNIAQSVTVTGIDDLVADGNKSYTIVLSPAVSADTSYNGFDPSDIAMTSTDNGAPGFTLSATSGLVTTESGGTASFTVRLNTLPTANVSLALSSGNTTEGTVSPASLTFTTANWNNTQTVTVTGVADNRIDGNIAYTIITAAATSADAAYNGVNPPDVSVTNNNTDAGKYIFVSNGTTRGNFGGPAAADALCNADAAKPRLGTYRAVIGHATSPVLSDPGPPAVYDPVAERELFTDWVLYGSTKYYRGADGKLTGITNTSGIFSGTLTNPVHNSAITYWTGLNAGYISNGCAASSVYPSSLGPTWGSVSSSRTGRVGDGATNDANSAIGSGTQTCNQFLPLLCAEQ